MKLSPIVTTFAERFDVYAKSFNEETKAEDKNLEVLALIYDAQNKNVREQIMLFLSSMVEELRSAQEKIQTNQNWTHHYTPDSMVHMIKFGLFGSTVAVATDIYNNGIPSPERFLWTAGAGFVVGSQVANRFFPRESIELTNLQAAVKKVKARLATIKPGIDIEEDKKEKALAPDQASRGMKL